MEKVSNSYLKEKRLLFFPFHSILNGLVIGNGDTVGNTKEEKLRVTYAQGMRLSVPVLKITAGMK